MPDNETLTDTIDKISKSIGFRLPSVQLPHQKSYTYSSPVPALLVENLADQVNEPCVLGVDEAGRGPCLGPMVYAVSYCPVSRHQEFKAMGFDDSKKLTEDRRTALAKIIEANLDWVGWAVYVISPQDISIDMLKRSPRNLNKMAHDATIELIRTVLEKRVNLTEIYVDPVGPSKSYQVMLSRLFPGISITVEPKADSLYPIVSAASICAKVTRDQIVQNWIWTEKGLDVPKDFGSGYPSDPNTVKWLKKNRDKFFGYPSIIRFSWKTISSIVEEPKSIEWSEDEDEPLPKLGKQKKPNPGQFMKPAKIRLEGKLYAKYRLDSVSEL